VNIPSLLGAKRSPVVSAIVLQRERWRLANANTKRDVALLMMMLPGLLVLFVFAYLPMFGIIIAFKDYRAYQGVLGSQWVGLKNFQYLFGTDDARRIVVNTLAMNALFIVSVLVVALAIALLLKEVQGSSRWLSKFYQSTLFFPYLFSYVIINYFVFALLNTSNGFVNHTLEAVGVHPVNWYQSAQSWPVILTLVTVWKNAGSSPSTLSTTRLPPSMARAGGGRCGASRCPC